MCDDEPFPFDMTRRRTLSIASKPATEGDCVVYWMSRDQRAEVSTMACGDSCCLCQTLQKFCLCDVLLTNLPPPSCSLRRHDCMFEPAGQLGAALCSLSGCRGGRFAGQSVLLVGTEVFECNDQNVWLYDQRTGRDGSNPQSAQHSVPSVGRIP
jgi:hypothetical protein